jgi:FkbM family methyltransferase
MEGHPSLPGSGESASLPLPLPVRAFAALSALPKARAIALRLAAATLRPATVYRGAHGLLLRIDPADHFQRLMLLGWFDPVLIELLRRYARPGQVVIDAGAFIGYATLHLARAVGPGGQVHTFECDPRLVERIGEHMRLNRADWVRVNPLAVYDRSGEQLAFHLTDQLGWSTYQEGVWEARRTVAVETIALDDYIRDARIDPSRIGLIKLDVEGAEMRALEGMVDTLERATATVIMEYQPWRVELGGRKPDDLFDLMHNCGYEPWAPRVLDSGAVDLVRGSEPSVGEDILFLPR